MIKRTPSGWFVDVQPGGRGHKRHRKTLPTKAEAIRWETWISERVAQDPEWKPAKRDARRLSALVKTWHELHGIGLKDGDRRKTKLLALCDALDNPIASELTSRDFARYRKDRIAAGTHANTLNHEHAYLRALFNELTRAGEWTGTNPLAHLRPLPVDEQALTYLTDEEIDTLLTELDTGKGRNKDAAWVARVCLSTGARWSEAETLRREHVTPQRVTYEATKSSRVRSVPISDCLYRQLTARGPGRLFKPCYGAFRSAVLRIGLTLPAGQMTHVLRHTFASHFMQRGGNILVLQRILGHANITMTMRYAHFAPDHLEEAVRLGPLG